MHDEARGSVDTLRARQEQVEQALANQLHERAAEATARRTQQRRLRGSGFDGCYFSSCPAGTTPLFGTVTCPAGVRVGSSNASGTRWYGDCGATASCAIFVEAWCSRVLR